MRAGIQSEKKHESITVLPDRQKDGSGMRFEKWLIDRRKIKIVPTTHYWQGLKRKAVPVSLSDMPIVYWLLLKDVVFDINYAPYIVSTYLDITPERVMAMKAGRVIALFNHIKHQVKKCNSIYEWVQEDLLNISADNIDNSHFDNLHNLALLFDLMGNGNRTMKEAEQLSFTEQMNYLKIKNAYIRSEQNRYLKSKNKKHGH